MSRREQQPLDFSSRHSPLDQVLIVTPITSKPCSLRRYAHTELSTPPDMATTTLGPVADDILRFFVVFRFFFGGTVLDFLEGFLEFPYSFSEALAYLGKAV